MIPRDTRWLAHTCAIALSVAALIWEAKSVLYLLIGGTVTHRARHREGILYLRKEKMSAFQSSFFWGRNENVIPCRKFFFLSHHLKAQPEFHIPKLSHCNVWGLCEMFFRKVIVMLHFLTKLQNLMTLASANNIGKLQNNWIGIDRVIKISRFHFLQWLRFWLCIELASDLIFSESPWVW